MTLKVYKKVDGTLVDPVKHTREVFLKHPEAVMYIGTDSQTHRRSTAYATVIAYRYGHRGVHYIYTLQLLPKIKNLFDRLLKETEFSLECAEMLSENGLKPFIESIDLDFNSLEEHGSHTLISASMGWVTGLGYKARVKIPESKVKDDEILIACKAADHQVRHLSSKDERKANRRLKRKKHKSKKK